MGIDIPQSILMHEDNQRCIHLPKQEDMNLHSKHIDIKYHLVKHLQEEGMIKLTYCPKEEMIADVLTKLFLRECFEALREKINLVS